MKSLSEYLMESDKLKKYKGHEYVDLGLPSGTLWATENIKDTGGNELYFAWGDATGYTHEQVGRGNTKKAFGWSDHKFGPFKEISKYNGTDRLTVLEPEDDAAIQNWGAGWKIPTKGQFDELLSGTTQEWKEVNGVNGLLCTSKTNGNTVFFAAAGYATDGRVYGVDYYGSYWSVSLDNAYIYKAWDFYFDDRNHGVANNNRCHGFSVRPVRG